jgi:hypothetical protein
MTVGIQIFNQNNESVIDGETPTYMLLSQGAFNGTVYGNGSLGLYTYDFSAYPYYTPKFIKLNVGDRLYNFGAGVITNKASLEVKIPAPANTLSDPTGYGLVVRNSSGQKVWFANAPVAVIENFSVIQPTTGTYTTNSEWVALVSALPWFAPTGSGLTAFRSTGLQRFSSYYQWHAVQLGTIGSSDPFTPKPVSAIFAKE